MEEQLINFETAKLAKEKGFNWKCYASWDSKGVTLENTTVETNIHDENEDKWFDLFSYNTMKEVRVDCPTQSLLQKWLREENNTEVVVRPLEERDNGIFIKRGYQTTYIVYNTSNEQGNHCTYPLLESPFNTYEEALEKGLQEALKLI